MNSFDLSSSLCVKTVILYFDKTKSSGDQSFPFIAAEHDGINEEIEINTSTVVLYDEVDQSSEAVVTITADRRYGEVGTG